MPFIVAGIIVVLGVCGVVTAVVVVRVSKA
jgi:hypothetical protein